MKLFSLEEMGTGQVVRKEIQCAFNFVWKILFSSTLLNIVLFLPNKSSNSNYCPNGLLKLCSGLCFRICYFCCHLLIAVFWSFYFFPTIPWHLGCLHTVPWSLDCLPLSSEVICVHICVYVFVCIRAYNCVEGKWTIQKETVNLNKKEYLLINAKHRWEEQPHLQGAVAVQGGPRGATPCSRSGGVAMRRYPSSKVRSSGCALLEQL